LKAAALYTTGSNWHNNTAWDSSVRAFTAGNLPTLK
jgi:hypothetical protein